MGQRNSKYIQYVDKSSDISLSDPKLIIKCSTAINGGNGVFTEEFIPKGTIFCKSDPYDTNEDVIGRYINDLLYRGDAKSYEQNELTNNVTNIGYLRTKEESPIFTSKNITCYCIALVDINADQELSRYYGPDYWFHHEYQNTHKLILDRGEYPSDYFFLDEYRIGLMYNHCYYVFVKCIDGKYSYVYGVGIPSNYYLRIDEFNSLAIFENRAEADKFIKNKYGEIENMSEELRHEFYEFKYLINCSKPDLGLYQNSEPINFNECEYYSTKYLQSKSDKTGIF